MTNKINGIDVSECKNFYCGICEEENKIPRTIEHFTADCIFYPNCYYKQLKRLQEENEKLKADLKGETEQCQKWYQLETDKHFQMLKYEQALEEIREMLKKSMSLKSNAYNHFINVEKAIDKINEVLNVEND